MSLPEEMAGASVIAEDIANVRPGEHVLIVADWRSGSVTDRLATAVDGEGAEVTIVVMEPRADEGNEPPPTVAAAMQAADVIISVPDRAIGHSAAAKRALENGARFVAMGTLSTETLRSDGLRADFPALGPKVRAMAERLSQADEARLVAENGTDLRLNLSGRAGNGLSCTVSEPGEFTVAYCAEANVTPVPDGTDGRIVFDGSIPSLGIGLLDDDVVVDVEDGMVTSIEGGEAARRVEQVWASYDVPAVRQVAELAVGMNPKLTRITGDFINDRGVDGVVHIGFGTSSNLGGETRTPLHFDCTVRWTTLELDGERILEDRDFVGLDS